MAAATLPLSSPLFTSVPPQTRMDQETADRLNDQIDDELKVTFLKNLFYYYYLFYLLLSLKTLFQ